MIPKIIHYCWFGDGELCPLSKKCMLTWEQMCPDYEVMRWDESNIDLDIPFIAENLEKKQWAFVSDYVRLQQLYLHGGIYLDTDVEIIKPVDDLLEHKCFLGEELPGRLNSAVLGAEPRHLFVKASLELIEHRYEESKPYLIAPEVCTKVVKNVPDEVTIFPVDYFYPYNPFSDEHSNRQLMFSHITENTYAIHHWAKSWRMPLYQRVFRKLGVMLTG